MQMATKNCVFYSNTITSRVQDVNSSSSAIGSSEDEYDSDISGPEAKLKQVCISYIEANTTNSSETKIPNTFRMRRRRYWRINFTLVLAPFFIWGIPVHLLISGKQGIKSTKDWLRFIFFEDKQRWKVFLLTIPFALVSLTIYGYVVYLIIIFFDDLVIKGQFSLYFFDDLVRLLHFTPILVPMTTVWFLGYTIKNLLYSFDKLQCPAALMGKDETEVNRQWNSLPSYRLYLVATYSLIMVHKVVQILLVVEDVRLSASEEEATEGWKDFVTGTWIDFFISFMYNLMLPIYIAFALAIEFEFRWLIIQIKALIQKRIFPSAKHFDDIKQYFKTIGYHVLLVNDLCNVYFSWTLLVLIGQLQNETIGSIMTIASVIIDSGGSATEKEVRLLVGFVSCIILQFLIIFLTVWFAIGANDMARDVHVRLNDFVSQPDFVFSPELYRKFRMLKYYIHSRMETEKPILLTLYAAGILPFGLYTWMTNYRVRH